jgi:uncharacterized protein YbaP (TraB family)
MDFSALRQRAEASRGEEAIMVRPWVILHLLDVAAKAEAESDPLPGVTASWEAQIENRDRAIKALESQVEELERRVAIAAVNWDDRSKTLCAEIDLQRHRVTRVVEDAEKLRDHLKGVWWLEAASLLDRLCRADEIPF